jgi:hypothetical protein
LPKKKLRNPDKRHVFLSDELGTNLVAEAAFSLDIPALCRAYGVSLKTLERWKVRCSSSPALTEEVSRKKSALQTEWSARAVLTLNELLITMRWQAQQVRSKEYAPGDMRETAGAVKLLGEVLQTQEFIPGLRGIRQNQAPAAAGGVGDRAGRGSEPARRAGAPAAGGSSGPAAPTGQPQH